MPVQASPAWHSPDAGNMPKLLGAYRVAVDGVFVAAGPGRNRDGEQPVDVINVTSFLTPAATLLRESSRLPVRAASRHVIALSCYHTNHTKRPPPSPCPNAACPSPWGPGAETARLLLELTVDVVDPTTGATSSVVVSTADRASNGSGVSLWQSSDGGSRHNPSGNAGTVWYGQPEENFDARVSPGWWMPGDVALGSGWASFRVPRSLCRGPSPICHRTLLLTSLIRSTTAASSALVSLPARVSPTAVLALLTISATQSKMTRGAKIFHTIR